jgi:hypothetical protein
VFGLRFGRRAEALEPAVFLIASDLFIDDRLPMIMVVRRGPMKRSLA